MLTGKVANNGYNVTFSHIRNKKLQGANLQWKKVYWPEMERWVSLKISTRVRHPTQAAAAADCRYGCQYPSSPLGPPTCRP